MKRHYEQQEIESNKKTRTDNRVIDNVELPSDLWGYIAEYLDDESLVRIAQTSRFFFNSRYSNFRLIKMNFFDFHSDEELNEKLTNIDSKLSLNEKIKKLLVQFVDQRNKIENLNPGYSISTFLDKFAFFIKEGNILGLKSKYLLGIINILDSRSRHPMNLLGYAAIHKRKAIFNLLLSSGAKVLLDSEQDPNISEPEDFFDENDPLITYDLGLGSWIHITPIHIIAARHGDVFWLIDLFKAYKNLSSDLFSSQYFQALNAILVNDAELLKNLLKNNTSLINEYDKGNWKLIHWACCLKDSVACMDLLLANNLNFENEVLPLAFLAVSSGNPEALIKLNEIGADTAQDLSGTTALHIAAFNGEVECAKLLLSWGHACDITNDFGDTPFSLANISSSSTFALSDKMTVNQLPTKIMLKKEKCAELFKNIELNQAPRPFNQ